MLVVMGALLWILVVRSDNDREKGMHGIVGFFLVVIVFVRHREGWDIGRPMLLWTRNRFFVSFIISFFIHSFILGAYGIAEAAQAVLLVELGKAGAWNQANKQASKQCRPITSACLDEKGGLDSQATHVIGEY